MQRGLGIAIAALMAAIVGKGLVRRAIALALCGVLGFQSAACYEAGRAMAIEPPKLTQIPRIRRPSLELPGDFRVVRQVPFSSGRREILFTSASTGAEQLFSTSLPDADQFELFGLELRKASGIDIRPLLVGKNIQIEPAAVEASLSSFKVSFKRAQVSRVVLGNDTIAEFSAGQAVIKSPQGQEIERIPLTSASQVSTAQTVKSLLAQANGCQSSARASLQASSQNLTEIANQLGATSSVNALLVAGATTFTQQSLQNSNLAQQLTSTVCKPPVKCNEEVISGGSEIRTDLFQVSDGMERQVILEYEFYTIPDMLEMDFDGKQVFAVGPASGSATKDFSFPNNARYVGVKITGNQNTATQWWYKVTCNSPTKAEIDAALKTRGFEDSNYPYYEQPNGCSNSPDSNWFNSGTGFKPACDQHDRCYMTFGNSKKDCDDTFLKQMQDICSSGTPVKGCDLAADFYAWAVGKFGGGAYQEAQKQANKYNAAVRQFRAEWRRDRGK